MEVVEVGDDSGPAVMMVSTQVVDVEGLVADDPTAQAGLAWLSKAGVPVYVEVNSQMPSLETICQTYDMLPAAERVWESGDPLHEPEIYANNGIDIAVSYYNTTILVRFVSWCR